MAYVSVSRAQFRSLLDDQLGSIAAAFYRTDEKNKVIQHSLRFWNLLTGYWKGRATVTTVAAQLWYKLPSTITSSLRVTWQSHPLSPVSWHSMDFGRPSWRSETTSSGGDVPSQPQVFVIGSLNLLAIWPQDAAGNSAMTVDGLAATPILNNDSDKLDIGQEEFAALLDYCQHVCAFKEGGGEFKSTEDLLKSFLKAAGERCSILRECATYRKYTGMDKSRWQRRMIREDEEAGAR